MPKLEGPRMLLFSWLTPLTPVLAVVEHVCLPYHQGTHFLCQRNPVLSAISPLLMKLATILVFTIIGRQVTSIPGTVLARVTILLREKPALVSELSLPIQPPIIVSVLTITPTLLSIILLLELPVELLPDPLKLPTMLPSLPSSGSCWRRWEMNLRAVAELQ